MSENHTDKTNESVETGGRGPGKAHGSVPVQARARARSRGAGRRWVPYVGLLLFVGLMVAGLWPRPTLVETVKVGRGSLRTAVTEEGKTRVRQRYWISSPVTGQLQRIPFKSGAEVVAHETVLALIEPLVPPMLDPRARALAEARRDTAAAQLDKADTAHVFAVSELRRFEKLMQERTVSAQDFEAVQWREASAAREKKAAESVLREAEAELGSFVAKPVVDGSGATHGGWSPITIKAPVTGRVLKVLEESSRVVAAGTVLMEVGDPTDLEVVIEVLSRDGATLKAGTRVEMTQWGVGEEALEGRVRMVEPAAFLKVSALGVEEQRVNVVVDLVTPPEKRPGLGDQYRVIGHIVTWEEKDVLKVDTGALFRQGAGWGVYRLEGGMVKVVEVEVGKGNGQESQILKGLGVGDEVVVYPGEKVRDRQRVEVMRK